MLNAGDILIASDYYNDITNWYKVMEVKGKTSVKLGKLAKHETSGGGYVHSGDCMPDPDTVEYICQKTKRVRPDNSVKIDSYVTAYLWDGKPGTYNYDN